MANINFKTKLVKINDWVILHLPKEASAKLPSRGLTAVEGTINGQYFKQVLEPDGKGSHWFRVRNAKAGDTVKVFIDSTKDWPEPEIPTDLKKALKKNKTAQESWNATTPLAHWDWIRWVRAVKSKETREKHIRVAMDKLNRGMRRPCCFNRSLCSEPKVSKNWVLLDP